MKSLEGSYKDPRAVLQGLWKSRTGLPRSIWVLEGTCQGFVAWFLNRWFREVWGFGEVRV